jgi:hypothetical protein
MSESSRDLSDFSPAMARPVRATRALAPGGSFICPYTRAAFDPAMGLPVALSTAREGRRQADISDT